ncbi:MAG: ABC transporter ATP-binding protein [Ruminococcaceae bacterium]|nr:ABC transporter ATP-binding protein [Oscillospiraceae bacterium]
MKKETNTKTNHSTISNVFYLLKVMFKISPWLVIGEIFMHTLCTLPGRIVSIIGLKYVIDEVANGGDPKKILLGIGLILGVLVFGETINALFFELFVHREREKLDLKLQSRLYEKAASIDMAKYDSPEYYADFILSIENSSDNIRYMLNTVKSYVGEVIAFLTISSILLTIDPVALVVVLLVTIICLPLNKYASKLLYEYREKRIELHRKGDYFARVFYLPEYAGEIKISKISTLLTYRFNKQADVIVENEKKYKTKLNSLWFFESAAIYNVAFMLVLPVYFGYKILVENELTIGGFVATFNGVMQVGSSLMYLIVHAVKQFSERSKMIDKQREFLKTQNEIVDGEHIAECKEPETISVENIKFSYTGNEKDSLDGVSFEIEPFEKVALVGFNGAGKTTLTNLLLRLYDVKDGSIKIGGRDIREETVESHRNRFAAVFQDFQIFSATVGENVALSKDYDEKRVLEALKLAGFTKELPKGTETILLKEFDEDGLMLSGGEQQKIAIARVFYKNCPYIILDEPSANLDPISEYELNKNIMESAKEKTVIIISHRLSTTVNADRIIMLENGKVVEIGTHEELMNKNGDYAYMFNLQAEKYVK